MNKEVEDREKRLAVIFQEISQTLASSLDLRDLLGLIVDQAMEYLDADVTILRLLDRPGEHLEVELARGIPEEEVNQVRFRPGEGLAGRVLLDGVPVRGENIQKDPRVSQRALVQRLGLKAFIAVALHLHRQPIGVWFLMRRRHQPFIDEDQAILLAFADYASIGIERSWLLQAIVREKHESEMVLQATANGILVVDRHGRVMDMNPAMERLTGWMLRDARGQPCCDIVNCRMSGKADPSGTPVCPLEIEPRGKDRAFLEYPLHTRDGRVIAVEASYGLIRDEKGNVERTVMVFRDISRQKEVERQRAEIIANVSHELRTPLALIKGYATTLLSPQVSADEAETRRFLRNVSSAADRLGRLIDDLLSASRLDADQLRLRPQSFDLAPKVDQVLAWFQPHALECSLVADMPPEGLPVWADPDRVEQVLVNLLTNAAKYSDPGSTIVIQGQLIGDPPQAVVHVIDEGCGIASEHLPRIFDRFYLTESSKKGVGLGLFICQGLVEAMGGKIWVVSDPGEGSTFSFSLPVKVDPLTTVAG